MGVNVKGDAPYNKTTKFYSSVDKSSFISEGYSDLSVQNDEKKILYIESKEHYAKDLGMFNREQASQDILESLFGARDFIANESWEKSMNVHSRVISFTKTNVTCECLVDREKGIFETRVFPSYLFSHLKIGESPYIMLNIKSKAGSTRIDVYDGSKLVDKKYFQISDDWKQIEKDDFNTEISGQIKL